jgi:peptide/nickel transport system substrate-binding protein
MNNLHSKIIGTAVLLFLFSCGEKSKKENTDYGEFSVKLRMNPEPAGLNSLTVNDQNKTIILSYIAYPPLGIDMKKLDWTPILAKEMPVTENLPGGKQKVTLEIREEATWDNGSPILAEDVAFSLKLAKLPLINQQYIRGYYRDIEHLQIDPKKPRRYSVIFAAPYMLSSTIAGDMTIFPRYIYDSLGVLNNLTIKRLYDEGDNFKADSSLIAFAEQFSSEKFSRETIVGCGPYALESWEPGQRIVLQRKKNWWGDRVQEKTHYFQAYPTRLIFEFIKDETAAVTALKSGDLDFMYSIDPMIFTQDLPKSEKFTSSFNTFTPNQLGYESIGINTKREPLDDPEVRYALSHLADVERMISSAYYGLGNTITTYIPGSMDGWKNPDLDWIEFNPEIAQKILNAAGWTDSDENGVLDKIIKGKKRELTLELLYNTGNPRREKIALIYAEELNKNGIKTELRMLEIPALVERLKTHDFDFYVGGFIQSVVESDPYQLWHTESARGGTNFTSFGNAESDSLINAYRLESDVKKRQNMSMVLQGMIYENRPVIFLCTGKERMAVKKNLEGILVSDQRPGFWLGGLHPVAAQTSAK